MCVCRQMNPIDIRLYKRQEAGLWYGEQEVETLENARCLQTRFPRAGVKVFAGYSHADDWMKDMAGYLRDIAAFTEEPAIVAPGGVPQHGKERG